MPDEITGDLTKKLKAAPSEIHKFDIVRTVIEGLNARGEMMLKQRREVLRRVIEFENFDTCWPADQLKAKGLVASIREVISKKDAFTRINLEREQERQARLAQAEQANRAKQERAARIEVAKNEFYALFSSGVTRQARGKKLEATLNNLFNAYGILIHEAFHLVGESGQGIVEQIDGVIELKGALYFVEMKWYEPPLAKPK